MILAGCGHEKPQKAKIYVNGKRFVEASEMGLIIASQKNNTYQELNNNLAPNKNEVVVKSGDGFYAIAKRYSVSTVELAAINHLHYPYDLKIGQKLILPDDKVYKIQEGDTLSKIANLYDLTTNQLVTYNALERPYKIKVGQVLKICQKCPSLDQVSNASNNKKENNFKTHRISKPNFIWPLKGRLISLFGHQENGVKNDGIYIAAPEGSKIKSVAEGVVIYQGNKVGNYGNLVIIEHKDSWYSTYAYLKDINVKLSQKVRLGENIGSVGLSSKSQKSMLFFSLRHDQLPLDPLKYLPKKRK